MHWHVIHVRANQEDAVVNLLSKHEDIEAFVPRLVKLHKRQGKFVQEKYRLFPNYVFVKTKMNVDTFYALIQNNIREMVEYLRIVRHQDRYLDTLYEEEKAYLSQFLNEAYEFGVSEGMIIEEKVVIIDGPLKGFEAQIVKINRHKRTAMIQLPLLGQEQELSVSLNILVKK